MSNFNKFLSGFTNPAKEFGPMPFWFLNDALDHDRLRAQIRDFAAKGVAGVVIHPRMGIPADTPYMSEKFLDAVEVCVREAAALSLSVVLYDEGMYPSGSACGQVAAADPTHAARCLRMAPAENALSDLPVIARGTLPDGSEAVFLLDYTHGHIRGIHPGQEDGDPGAPLAGDLLNPAAVENFIRLTHEKYYKRLAPYFGMTVIGMFTDEPSVTGRGPDMAGAVTWSVDFMAVFAAELPAGVDAAAYLPALFLDLGEQSRAAAAAHEAALHKRLGRVFFAALSRWCRSHGIALMGHPSGSGDLAAQLHFGVPGQDLVWRYISPEHNLDSPHGTLGKSAVDMARHLGLRRNSNEAFGCCGQKDNPWDFSFTDMLWYTNWLMVRGANLLFPHAFYYSLAAPLQWDERPPDVGPGNVWWPDYAAYADYVRRLCYVNTDSLARPALAVLCGDTAPHEAVAGLYAAGIDFQYVSTALPGLLDGFDGGVLRLGDYTYRCVCLEPDFYPDPALAERLDAFQKAGGLLYQGLDFTGFVRANLSLPDEFLPANPSLRRARLEKDGVTLYLLSNECGPDFAPLSGMLRTALTGRVWRLDPFTGAAEELAVGMAEGSMEIPVELAPAQMIVLAIDSSGVPRTDVVPPEEPFAVLHLGDYMAFPPDTAKMDSLTFETTVKLPPAGRYVLALDGLDERCRVYADGVPLGNIFRHPLRCALDPRPRPGECRLRFEVDGSRANRYGNPKPMGLRGARILAFRQE